MYRHHDAGLPCLTKHNTVEVALIRHAHGVHNDSLIPIQPGNERQAANWVRILRYNINGELILDGSLSIHGMNECEKFRDSVVMPQFEYFRRSIIAVSPFKRNVMSALLMFAPIFEQRDAKDRWILLDPTLQERNNAECNIGLSTQKLRDCFEQWVKLEDADRQPEEITKDDLIQVWLNSKESGLGTRPLTEIWVEKGWLSRRRLLSHRNDLPGKSTLGDAILFRELRRRLSKFPKLATVRLLTVGDDITEQDWIEKRDMVYHAPPQRCFAPFPDLFVRSLNEARENLGTRWAKYVPLWKKKVSGFEGFPPDAPVVGIIHSGLTAALVRQWGSFRFPKNYSLGDKVVPQVTSHEILDAFCQLKPGDRYIFPRLDQKPKVYGYWTYSREDSCKTEWIQGEMKKKEDGWQVVETPYSLERRTKKHMATHGRQIRWFTEKQNKIWDKYIVACLMAPGYVLQAQLGDEVMRNPENAISVEFGGWDSDPLRWRWFVGTRELGFTLGSHGGLKEGYKINMVKIKNKI